MKNKNLKFSKKELVQVNGRMESNLIENFISTSEILSEVINIADPQAGYGDLKEQKDRLSILEKCQSLSDQLDVEFEFSDSEIKILKKCFSTFKPFVLSSDLINLQEEIQKL